MNYFTKKDEKLNLAKEKLRKDEEEQINAFKKAKQEFIENYKVNPYNTIRNYLFKILFHLDPYYYPNIIKEDVLEKLIKLEAAFNGKEK